MSTSEQARRGLERRLEEVLGEEHALTMMQHLPPGESATKLDLDNLEHRLNQRMDGFDTRMERFEGRMDGFERKIDDLGPHLIALMDGKFAGMEGKMESMEGKMEGMLGKMEGTEGRLVAMFHQQLAAQTRVFFFSTAGLMLTLAAVLRAG